MKKLYAWFLLLFLIQKGIGQPWTPLGSNEATRNSITVTGALTFFTQVSSDKVPYISYIDDLPSANTVGDFKVHAKRFINGQWEIAGDGISPAFPGSDDFPVALDGNIPYVAYSEAFTPVEIQNRLTVKRLNSNTNTWELVGPRGFSDGTATGTVIATDNDKIYVAYQDGAFDSKITVKSFDNSNPALGWKTLGPTGFSDGFVLGANIAIDNGIPYVSYIDFTDHIPFVKKFNGVAWENVGSNNPSDGKQVAIHSLIFDSRHIPYITFVDSAGSGFVRNLNANNTWVTTGNQPFATGIDNTVSLSILQDIPFIAFAAKQNGISQVNVKRFDAANNTWPDEGTQPISASTSDIVNTKLETDSSNKLIIFYRNLNEEIYAKTFDATAVLPVTLTSFTITNQNQKSFLQWVTASEINNKLYEIEHSTDAAIFRKVGEVDAKVPANVQQSYSFVHSSPARGINYYRLKQVDNDGNFAYSKVVSITFRDEQQPVITLFPNPVRDVLHAEYKGDGEKDILIRNIEGKIIKRLTTGAKSIDINIAGLPKGTYFLTLYTDKIIETKSFIK